VKGIKIMNTGRLTLALAVAGLAIGAAAAPAASADVSDADVSDGQSSVSANWSGYRVATQDGTGFSKVSGSWVEPSAKCDGSQTHASFWVGLGGSSAGNGALEQTGTAVDCGSDGNATHYVWYELLPARPVQLNLSISPGDHMSSSVAVSGTTVTINVIDESTGDSATKSLEMDDPDALTAEWIAEAPSTCDGSGNCQPLALANFGTVSFKDASATASGHTGAISDSGWTSQPVALSPSAGGSTALGLAGQESSGAGGGGARPSSLSGDGSSFSVSYVSPDSVTSGGSGAGPVDPSGGSDPYGSGDPYGSVDPYGSGDPYGGGDPYGSGDPYGGYGPSAVLPYLGAGA
jgi:hypothetical protein